MMRDYPLRVATSLSAAWDMFWFTPAHLSTVARLRMLVALVAGVWFAGLWMQVNWYFSPGGWLHGALAKPLSSATHGQWTTYLRLSPLWYVDQPLVYQIYLIVGCLLALVAILGLGGRWTMAALFMWILLLSQRLVWISSSAEPALIAMTGYLIFQPGQPLWGKRLAGAASAEHWTAGLTIRLMQTHWWLLVAFGLLLQLANVSWWQGNAVWWLAATGRSMILSTSLLQGRELLVNLFTHGIVLVEIFALVLLPTKLGRPLGYVLGLAVCFAYAFIADQMMYGMVLAASLHAFGDRDFTHALQGKG